MTELKFQLSVHVKEWHTSDNRADVQQGIASTLGLEHWDFVLSDMPAAFGREELIRLIESVEITYNTMDRPVPGTREELGALLTKLRTMYANGYVDPAEVKRYADLIMADIHDDIARGMVNSHGVTIPKYPGSFSAMHEYTDANMYVLDHMGDIALAFDDEANNALVNAVTDECDRRLLAEYKEACEQVGQESGEDFAANCICARGAAHFHAIWPDRGCQSPRCAEGCQGYFRE